MHSHTRQRADKSLDFRLRGVGIPEKTKSAVLICKYVQTNEEIHCDGLGYLDENI